MESRRGRAKVSGYPAGLFYFIGRNRHILASRAGAEAQHDGGWEGPGLAGIVSNICCRQADLFHHFTGDRVFQAFPRLYKSRQDRAPPRWPIFLTAQHDPVGTIMNQHDHRRISAGKMGRATVWIGTASLMPALARVCRAAADATE